MIDFVGWWRQLVSLSRSKSDRMSVSMRMVSRHMPVIQPLKWKHWCELAATTVRSRRICCFILHRDEQQLGHTGQTLMNERSSRSHAIFTITIECSDTGPDGGKRIRVGKLHMVDLAVGNAIFSRTQSRTKVDLSRVVNVNRNRALKEALWKKRPKSIFPCQHWATWYQP